jgi:hypothetical protein
LLQCYALQMLHGQQEASFRQMVACGFRTDFAQPLLGIADSALGYVVEKAPGVDLSGHQLWGTFPVPPTALEA